MPSAGGGGAAGMAIPPGGAGPSTHPVQLLQQLLLRVQHPAGHGAGAGAGAGLLPPPLWALTSETNSSDSGGWTGEASAARLGGRGAECTVSGGASGDVRALGPGFPPDLRPRAPLAPLLFSLRNSLRRPDVAWRAAAWASRWRSSRGTRPRAGAGGRPGAPTGSRTGSGAQLPPRAPSTPPTPRPPRSPSGGRAGCPPPLPQGGQGGGGECQQLLGHEGVQAVPRPGVGEAAPLPLLSPLLLL